MERENMRVIISKRMIREGLLRCLEKKNIDRISISELCKEAQVNRATFYNHYDSPADVLTEISWEIVKQIEEIYQGAQPSSVRKKTISVLSLLQKNADMLKIIFSANANPVVYKTAIETFTHFWESTLDLKNSLRLSEEEYRMAITAYGWAGFYMIRQWIMDDIDKTPQEMMDLLDRIFGNRA